MNNHTTIKIFITALMLFVSGLISYGQDFTWMRGANTLDPIGNYGTMGVASITNDPGARGDAVQWRDASGKLWMFGGFAYDALGTLRTMNDLWMYDPLTNQWTWMKGDNIVSQPDVYGTQGVPSPANKPGARSQSIGWADNQGNLWLMGGYFLDNFSNLYWYNDLWKYNIATNQWTWMKGSNITDQNGVYGTMGTASPLNVPGARYDAASWIDATGNMWLFGGLGFDGSTPYAAYLNDLWRYNPSTNEWTWMSGSAIVDQNGSYGTVGLPSLTNIPGGRVSSRGAVDASGNFWLFGGFGFDLSSNIMGEMNDLWRYNPVTGAWTWVKGSNITDQNGTYGTMGVPAAINEPGGRESHTMWADASGNFWVFGGFGMDGSTLFSNQINDLWKYSLATNQWTWVKGPNTLIASGVYGTQGTPSALNIPGARKSSAGWVDASFKLWLFGGIGYDNGTFGLFNDMWRLTFCVGSPIGATSSQSLMCAGNSAILAASGANTYAWSTNQFTSSIVISPSVTTVYTVTGTDVNGCVNSATVQQQVIPSPTLFIGTTSLNICSGASATIAASSAATYTWNNVQQSSFITVTPSVSTVYTVQGAGSNGCKKTQTFTQNVIAAPVLSISSTNSIVCKGKPVALNVNGAASYSWHTSAANNTSILLITPVVTMSYSVTGISSAGCQSTMAFTQSVSACVGVDSYEAANAGFRIFPNPNAGEFFITSDDNQSDNDVLIIVSALGQVVAEQPINSVRQPVNVQLEAGVYLCQVNRLGQPIYKTRLVIR